MAADDTGRVVGEAWAEWTEEVRLAMGWNGGVSLAIWMGGVAVEVDQARRARRPVLVAEATSDPAKVAGPAKNTPELYGALLLAFDRLLVVDILAGASAGGLNGALLAGAMMHDKQLEADFLRGKWITIGDFGTLLQPLSNKSPSSVMQGQRYFEQLRATFVDLLGTTAPPSGFGCSGRYPVLLDVQVTDVLGKQFCFRDDWEQPFFASEYRAPARFRRADDYTAGTLAAAARASSSFPAAFEPQMLNGKAAALIGFPGKTRWAIDGGLLENAPIKPAIELIPRVPTALPVKRYVCYVNAAPTGLEEEDDTPPGQPTLAKVLGYTINLPRDGRVIDQLYALDDASRRAGVTADAGVKLLALDRDVLRATAKGLLATYQNRRALLSLTELLGNVLSDGLPSGGPGRARHALEGLASLPPEEGKPPGPPAARLPWIPASVDPPGSPEEWRWGVRVAQRALQLQLDALRAGLRVMTVNDDVTRVITALHEIGRELHALDALYDDFADPLGASVQATQRLLCDKPEDRERALDDLTSLARGIGATVYSYLRPATAAFAEAYNTLSASALEQAGLPAASDLFGADGIVDRFREADPLAGYLRRALAIETIRRSFSDDFDIDSAQPLHVAQLTPLVPAPLFDPNPLGDKRGRPTGATGDTVYAGPVTARDKLAGLRLSHFAGFYRASWRENDFMWGRLDGAAAITRLLVDSRRTQALAKLNNRDPELAPWNQLAAALVPADADDERLRLIIELLEHASDSEPLPADRTPDAIRPILAEAMRRDLLHGDGTLTAAACTRALQYEIMLEEVPHLLEQVRADKEAGAYRAKLDWQTDDGIWEVIQELRGGDDKQRFESLPVRLGCDDADEATSTLALRTLSQTMLVALAALAGALPLTKSLQPVRLPLLAVAGATARRLLDRVAVAVGFAGAAWYLSGRWLTIPAPIPQSATVSAAQRTAAKADEIPLHAVWSPQVIVLWLAIFSVIGVVAIPGLRAVRTHSMGRRIWEGAVALVLLVCGGAVVLGWQWDLHGTITALTSWHSNFSPPDKLLWAAAAAGGVHAASSLDTVLRFAGPVVNRLGKSVSLSSLTLAGIGGALAYYAVEDALYPALRDGGFNTVCAILALAGPVAVASYVSVGPALWKNLKRLASFIKRSPSVIATKAASAKQWLQQKLHWPWRRK